MNGSGFATYLGPSANTGRGFVTGQAACAGGFLAQNDEVLTSSNGRNQITFTSHTKDCPVSPGVFKAVGTFIVTGGTGRFVGVHGSGALTGSPDFNQGTFKFSFIGTLSGPSQ